MANEGSRIESVAVIRLSSIGDIVLTEPVLAALSQSFPEAEIGFVVKRQFRDLVASHPALTGVHVLEDSAGSSLLRLARELRSTGYRAAVDLHRNLRTAFLIRASRIPMSTAYRKRELWDSLSVRLLRRPFRASGLLVERYLEALRSLGVPEASFRGPDGALRRPRLYLSEEDRAGAEEVLRRVGPSDGPYAVIVPGAKWATKRWPWERFAEVASGLVSRFGLGVLLLGARSETGLCDAVRRSAGAGVSSAAGLATLGETGGLISGARLFVGNDSGPTHMAMALGVPSVALFGPTDPGQFDHSGHELVYRDLECSACSFYGGRECPRGHWDCMMTVGAAKVLSASERLLEREPENGASGS